MHGLIIVSVVSWLSRALSELECHVMAMRDYRVAYSLVAMLDQPGLLSRFSKRCRHLENLLSKPAGF